LDSRGVRAKVEIVEAVARVGLTRTHVKDKRDTKTNDDSLQFDFRKEKNVYIIK